MKSQDVFIFLIEYLPGLVAIIALISHFVVFGDMKSSWMLDVCLAALAIHFLIGVVIMIGLAHAVCKYRRKHGAHIRLRDLLRWF